MRFEYPSLRQGLVGAWCPSLGASGLTLIDRSGRNNHGVLTNMGGQDNWRASGSGVALNFDGSNDSVILPARQFPQTAFSLSLWSRSTTPSATQALVAAYNGGVGAYFQLYQLSSAYYFILHQAIDAVYIGRTGGTVTSSMVHIAATWNGGTAASSIAIYINGVQTNSTAIANGSFTGPFSSPVLWSIGSQLLAGAPNAPLSGALDDVRIYNRALTPAEIRLLASRRGIGLTAMPDRAVSMPRKLSINVGGTWRPADAYVHDGTAFRLSEAKINVGGVWK